MAPAMKIMLLVIAPILFAGLIRIRAHDCPGAGGGVRYRW